MTTLQEIWDLPLNQYLNSQGINTINLSEIDSYLLTLELRSNELQPNEFEIIEDPLFEEIISNLSNVPHNIQLNQALELYNEYKQNPEKIKIKEKKKVNVNLMILMNIIIQ